MLTLSLKNQIDDEEVGNWQILVLLILINVLVAILLNHLFMSRDVFSRLYGSQLEEAQIDMFYLMNKKYETVQYLFLPVLLSLRVVFVALLFQFVFLISLKDISFGRLFRVTLMGFSVITAGTVFRSLWLIALPAGSITGSIIAIPPLSLAGLFHYSSPNSFVAGLLGNFNLFEAAWIAVMTKGLMIISDCTLPKALAITAGVWTAILVFQSGLSLYLIKIFGS